MRGMRDMQHELIDGSGLATEKVPTRGLCPRTSVQSCGALGTVNGFKEYGPRAPANPAASTLQDRCLSAATELVADGWLNNLRGLTHSLARQGTKLVLGSVKPAHVPAPGIASARLPACESNLLGGSLCVLLSERAERRESIDPSGLPTESPQL